MRKLLAALCVVLPLRAAAQADGPAFTEYLPQKVPARVVVMLSGASGAVAYQDIAQDLARLGYYTVLIDANHLVIRRDPAAGGLLLAQAIERAQRSPHAAPGKVAVVGFSMGGGAALTFAARQPEKVGGVVAYYPTTSFITNMESYVQRFLVPVLVLAGGQDRFRNCCTVESMRAMEKAAKARDAMFELVVYADGDHGFNRNGPAYRRDYDTDAWRRTSEALRKALAD